ncbi:bifunctional adenosylcobinamide kinase/adenosylcobinamide-phosphate guanylyltransferase [Colwellia maritima]|uniref:bifunctional adenosylcobinamide kinase/adenosylcobinamide-phosphate guanylyltransferase n=1 Tax=Colwellia maritima TaxID=2912588 RepID=UPI003083FE94
MSKEYETDLNAQVIYIATAQSLDKEMSARIKQHQALRPKHWTLVESPTDLGKAIEQLVLKHTCEHEKPITILVDCLTLWLSNCLCITDGNCRQYEKQSFLNVLAGFTHTSNVHLVLVSNEVGHGIVPLGELSRHFVDQAGWLHQDIAAIANNVDFIMAGIALSLKSNPME